MSSFLLLPLRRRIRRRNQKKSVFAIMNACSSDQIGLFRCFIPPFHLLCGGSSSTRTQRTPFRASNPSKICWVHCAGDRQGSFFWCTFLISVLLVLFAYLVGCWCGGTWQRLSPGSGGWGASPGCSADLVRQAPASEGVTNSWFYCSLWCLIVQGGTNVDAVPTLRHRKHKQVFAVMLLTHLRSCF